MLFLVVSETCGSESSLVVCCVCELCRFVTVFGLIEPDFGLLECVSAPVRLEFVVVKLLCVWFTDQNT